jgi:hypothetical protein
MCAHIRATLDIITQSKIEPGQVKHLFNIEEGEALKLAHQIAEVLPHFPVRMYKTKSIAVENAYLEDAILQDLAKVYQALEISVLFPESALQVGIMSPEKLHQLYELFLRFLRELLRISRAGVSVLAVNAIALA